MNNMITYRLNRFLSKRGIFGKPAQICSMLILIVCMSLISGCEESEWSYTAPSIPLVSADYDFDQFGGNGTIVAGKTPNTLSASCTQTWISSLTVNGSTISFTVNPNTSISSRVAEIILTSGDIATTVTVSQSAALFTNQDEYIVSSDGGALLLEMPTELDYSFTIASGATWITSSQKVDKGLSLMVEPSSSSLPRSVTVTLVSAAGRKGKTFTITQQGYDFGIFPESLHFAVEGGSQNIVVSGKRSYSVNTNVPWLTFEKNAEGGIFTAASNVKGNDRSAAVTFTDDTYGATVTFAVTQDPDPTEYEDYLGDWEITAYNGDNCVVTLSVKEEKKTFNMTSVSWPGLTIECQWSTAYNGRRLTIYTQQLATNPNGSILLFMPAYSTATGVSFYTGIGSSAAYFTYDGTATITCTGGTSTAITGFVLYNRSAANDSSVGWYLPGGPNRFTNAVFRKVP